MTARKESGFASPAAAHNVASFVQLAARDQFRADPPAASTATSATTTVADRPAALAVPLGSVTVREWPLKDGDIRRYTGSKARKQADALEEFGFGEGDSGADTTGADDSEIKRKETEGVFILKDGYVKFVPVEIGIAGEDDFEILSGLEAGQTVVTGPFRILRQLKDGALVEESSKKGRRGSRASDGETED